MDRAEDGGDNNQELCIKENVEIYIVKKKTQSVYYT